MGGQKDQDQGEAAEATIRLVKTVRVESVEVELGLTSIPALDSATTTSYMASQLSRRHQGNPALASVTSTSCASQKGWLALSGGGDESTKKQKLFVKSSSLLYKLYLL